MPRQRRLRNDPPGFAASTLAAWAVNRFGTSISAKVDNRLGEMLANI